MPSRPPVTRLSRDALLRLFKKSRLLHRQNEFDIRYARSSSQTGRILVITPKKVGTAPARNKVRRRLKELFYQEGWYTSPFDLLVFCRKGAAELTYQDLKSILAAARKNLPSG